jgi:hypothetical protein
MDHHTYDAGERFLIGAATSEPTALIHALCGVAPTLSCVRALYVAQIYMPSDGLPPHPIVGIVRDGSTASAVFGWFQHAIAEANVRDTVDFVELTESRDDGIAKCMRRLGPFYVRDEATRRESREPSRRWV